MPWFAALLLLKAAEGDNSMRLFIYRGGRNERIPFNATHMFVENTKYVRSGAS